MLGILKYTFQMVLEVIKAPEGAERPSVELCLCVTKSRDQWMFKHYGWFPADRINFVIFNNTLLRRNRKFP